MINQYALGYKSGLDAAVKVCDGILDSYVAIGQVVGAHQLLTVKEAIAALPVPEVQWRDLTASEAIDAIREGAPDGGLQDITRAVIAKFKEKQL